ncbi:MAG: hypothetical protein WD889_01120 [Candidatus Colwellbacteria bacterium]
MLICAACGKPTRVGFRPISGSQGQSQGKKKIRYCKKCEATV